MSKGIRPTKFSEIIGQDDVINRLKVSVTGCLKTKLYQRRKSKLLLTTNLDML